MKFYFLLEQLSKLTTPFNKTFVVRKNGIELVTRYHKLLRFVSFFISAPFPVCVGIKVYTSLLITETQIDLFCVISELWYNKCVV